MVFKEVLDYWKSIVAFTIIIIGATVGLLAWAADQVAVVEAKQQLLHDRSYQNSRIVRKEDQITEAEREIEAIEDVPIEDLTPRKEKKVEKLDSEVERLEKEIEEIRVILQQSE